MQRPKSGYIQRFPRELLRRIATRHDRCAHTFFGAICSAATVISSPTDWRTPCLSRLRVSLAKKPSTAFGHEHEAGVKWKVRHGHRAAERVQGRERGSGSIALAIADQGGAVSLLQRQTGPGAIECLYPQLPVDRQHRRMS